MPPTALTAIVLLAIAILAGVAITRSIVIAQPDEWLLAIRNGKLVKAGVGIYLLRRPGDVVARFTSTMQRVSFAVDALSTERLRVSVEGFILWSVTGLRSQLAALEHEMGIRVEQIEILQIRPADEELLRQMSAEVEERVREQAGLIHLETDERAKRRTIESEARIAQERAAARQQELEREKALRLAQIANEREVKAREQEVAREQALTEESRAAEVAKAALEREEVQFAARLDRIRREAEANRDAIAAVASAEEKKSQGVRDHELSRLVAEKVGDALKALPLKEARWVTVSPDSPASSLAALISAAREMTVGAPKKVA